MTHRPSVNLRPKDIWDDPSQSISDILTLPVGNPLVQLVVRWRLLEDTFGQEARQSVDESLPSALQPSRGYRVVCRQSLAEWLFSLSSHVVRMVTLRTRPCHFNCQKPHCCPALLIGDGVTFARLNHEIELQAQPRTGLAPGGSTSKTSLRQRMCRARRRAQRHSIQF